MLKAVREYDKAGKLDDIQKLIVRKVRPPEELYDVTKDPHEINNLADDPAYKAKLVEMRGRLDTWMKETNDLGRTPETAEMYDSDMAPYLNKFKGAKANPVQKKIIVDNIALMKKWAKEGK